MTNPVWIDTHAHLDAPELVLGGESESATCTVPLATRVPNDAIRAAGVQAVVIPAVGVDNFAAVRALAHAGGHAYALGIHPLTLLSRTPAQTEADLVALRIGNSTA